MNQNQQKFRDLRVEYPVFTYQSCAYRIVDNELKMGFRFIQSEDIVFEPEISFPHRDFYQWKSLTPQQLNLLVFHCGMIELISYWKAACSPQVKIQAAYLSPEQIDWWKKLYFNGLGEFFFLNQIETNQEWFLNIKCDESAPILAPQRFDLANEVLIPVGGGKDSVVTLELMRSYSRNLLPMIINPRGATLACAQIAGFDREELVEVNRRIHPRLIELNEQGFWNGHTPFSAMLAFTTLIAAAASKRRHIALSNESSANETTVPDSSVNHQYSKSFEFERDFRTYVETYISPDFNYFSFLRPLSEWAIARQFAQQPAYHQVFRSCNVGSKKDEWCGHCPKCLFAFIILSPFLSPSTLKEIFGKDLLQDQSLLPILQQLIGLAPQKPFECVGTTAEVNAALQARLLRYPDNPASLLDYYQTLPLATQNPNLIEADFQAPHALDEEFVRLHPDAPSYRIALLGMGREGRSSYHYFRKLYPNRPITIIDQNQELAQDPILAADPLVDFRLGPDYLQNIPTYSLILQTPGISLKDHPDLETRPELSSQTDWFLRRYAQQTIGITGTKGKSTTAALTYHLLKSHFKDVLMLGNMGFPTLEAIEKIGPQTLIVCEFSSHQLLYIRRAPHVSVLLNLFQEHLDHYRSFKEYQAAKWNITKLQEPNDYFIYHADHPLIQDWICQSDFTRQWRPFSLSLNCNPGTCLRQSDLYCDGLKIASRHDAKGLKGEHNLLNVMAAIQVARLYGIEPAQIQSALSSFEGLPHRLQEIGVINGIRFINDSISTIPEATIAALQAVEGAHTLILGGFDRGIDYQPLYDYCEKNPIPLMLLIGQAGQRMYDEMKIADDARCVLCHDYAELVMHALLKTPEGQTCLLSPAASSYDMFKNFEERGRVFEHLVKTLRP